MNRRRHLLSVVVAAILLTSSVAPVAANHDDGFQVFSSTDDDDSSPWDTAAAIKAYAGGVVDRVKYVVSGPATDRTPSESATETAAFINRHDREIVDWYNHHRDAPESNQTVKVTVTDDDAGTSATRYVELDVDANQSTVTAIRVVESTSRNVTDRLNLSGQWVDTLPDEVELAYDTYVDADRPVRRNDTFVKRLAGQYASDTETTLFE